MPRAGERGVSRSEGEDLACSNDDREAPESAERHDQDASAARACAVDLGLHGVIPLGRSRRSVGGTVPARTPITAATKSGGASRSTAIGHAG